MKICAFCGKEFESKMSNRMYCSDKCRHSVKTKCAYCGKNIIRNRRKDGIYFCSRKCASFYSGKTILKECEHCGKSFDVKKSSVEYGWGKYCSKECANSAMKVSHYKVCPQCGKTFEWSKRNRMDQTYCSRECMKEAFRIPIDKELLQKLYIEEEFTTREIGHIIGRSKKVVLDYLKYYGIDVRSDGLGNRKRIKCNDGHMVRSYYERSFDNMLLKNGIDHEYDPRLPFYRRCMADFKVDDVYVEIWGMMEMEQYREKRKKKLALYCENGCKLLEVFPDDFKNIQNKIDELKSLINS